MKKKIIFLLLIMSHVFTASVYAQPRLYEAQGGKIPKLTIPLDWHQKEIAKAPSPVFLEKDYAKGYAVFKINYLDLAAQIFPEEEAERFEVSLTSEEYEPLVFTVCALTDLEDVRISADDLKNPNGALLSGDNIDIRVVSYFPKKSADKFYKLCPILLERFDSVDIKKNERKIFWLTIFIPEGTLSGDYKGKIYLSTINKTCGSIDVKITVLPFELQKPPVNFGIDYNSDKRWKWFYAGNLGKDLVDIKEHGLDNVTIYFSPRASFNGSKLNLYFSESNYCSPFSLDEFMEEYINAGFEAPAPFLGVRYPLIGELEKATNLSSDDREFGKYYAEAIKLIEDHRDESGWPEFLYSPQDEPANDQKSMKRAKRYLALIKKSTPNVRTFISLNGLRKGQDESKEFESWLDVRCYAFFNQALIDETLKSGDEFWIYNGGSESKDKALLDRFFYGFLAMKTKASGAAQWAYQWPFSLQSTPYDELFKQNEQGWYYTYPSIDGPVPTQYWEALREGIDDAKYIFTLEQYISKAKNSNDPNIIREAIISEEKLSLIMSKIDISRQRSDESGAARSLFGDLLSEEKAQIMDIWREEVKKETLKLYGLLNYAKR